MRRNLSLIFFLLCLHTGKSIAQQLSPVVISSSGGFQSNNSGMLSFTIGEMTSVETLGAPVGFLTQGFQQPFDFKTSLHQHIGGQVSCVVYPNPSDGKFFLLTESDEPQVMQVRISSMIGQVLVNSAFYQSDKVHVEPFNLADIAPGMYVITVVTPQNMNASLMKTIQIID